MSDFIVLEQPLPGITLLACPHSEDIRGNFIKYFNFDSFSNIGCNFIPSENFITRSKLGVLRGMHFQIGNAAHDKLVCCLKGRVLDVIVDIRPESPFFNKPVSFDLSEHDHNALFIAKGYAHGFFHLRT